MGVLVRGKPRPTEVLCVREVRAEMPAERVAQVRDFYTRLLRLEPWPDGAQIPGCLGLGSQQRGLLLQVRHDPIIDPVRIRVRLLVDGLDELRQRLDQQPWPYEFLHGLGWTERRMLLHDPAGNLIEVRESLAI